MLQLFKCFNQLGICQSVDATRKNVDALVTECDATMQSWKRELEVVPSDAQVSGRNDDQDSRTQGKPRHSCIPRVSSPWAPACERGRVDFSCE